jgi:hypothetical protein
MTLLFDDAHDPSVRFADTSPALCAWEGKFS